MGCKNKRLKIGDRVYITGYAKPRRGKVGYINPNTGQIKVDGNFPRHYHDAKNVRRMPKKKG